MRLSFCFALAALVGCADAASSTNPATGGVKTTAARHTVWPRIENICPRGPFRIDTTEKVESLQGVYLDGWFVPNPNILKTIATPFEITIGNETRSYRPDYGCIKQFGVVAAAGAAGNAGGTGDRAGDVRIVQHGTGIITQPGCGLGNAGGVGDDGAAGAAGKAGPNLRVYATIVKTRFQDRVVAFTVDGDARDFLLVPYGAPVTIFARGGEGGRGGTGGSGGLGGQGTLNSLAHLSMGAPAKLGSDGPKLNCAPLTSGAGASNSSGSTALDPAPGDGGQGGRGGSGGPGGDGGPGGTIEVLVDRRFPEIEKQITLDVSGGPGGAGGAGGPGGLPAAPQETGGMGQRAPGQNRSPSAGTFGDPGAPGPAGHPSPPGRASMTLADLALTPIPGLASP